MINKTLSLLILLLSLTEVYSRKFRKTGKANRIAFCLSLSIGLLIGIFLVYYFSRKMCPNGIRLNFFEEKTYRDMKRKKKKNLKSKKRDIEEEFYDADEFFDIGGYSHPTQAEKESMTSLIDNQGWDSSYLISRNSKTKNIIKSPAKILSPQAPSPIKELVKLDLKPASPIKISEKKKSEDEEEVDMWAEWNKTAGVPLSKTPSSSQNKKTRASTSSGQGYKHSLPVKPPPMKPPMRNKAALPPPSSNPPVRPNASVNPSSLIPLTSKNNF